MVMLLSTLRSLRELFSLTMDVHSRLRTESHQQVTGAGAHCAAQHLASARVRGAVRANKLRRRRCLLSCSSTCTHKISQQESEGGLH